ncbi:MAG: virulence protein RhuM/Fic/DOC family protein [Rickettsiales bacterium]|nr:virulence protein RhuM/Fic/DOC family protein [Rickettsiales bacterium]
MEKEIILYQINDLIGLEVQLDNDTVWINREQMADLFQIDRSGISRHIKKIFEDEELDKKSNVQKMHIAGSDKPIEYYSLDTVLSVGYRVNSKQATKFRVWATSVLKKHLVDGYTVNEKRLLENSSKIAEINKAIELINRGLNNQIGNLDEAKKLMQILSDYAQGLELLDNYDHEKLDKVGKSKKKAKDISVNEFLKVIEDMKPKFASYVFAMPKDDSFESSINQIYQTIGGKDAYPTLEEKAATLLYLITKNHSFADGNKRIAASCFLYFLNENNMLYKKDGMKIIDEEALAVLTLLIAESNPFEMETMKNIIINILNKGE